MSIELVNGGARLVAADGDAVSEIEIALDSGNLTREQLVPNVKAPAFSQKGWLLFQDEGGLEILSPASALQSLPLAATDLQFERMGDDWIHLWSPQARRHWALHLATTGCRLSELPAPAGGER